MTLKDIINTVANEESIAPRAARQIVIKSLQMITQEIQAGQNVRIPGVCVIRSKEIKAGAGQPEADKIRVGIMRPLPEK